MEMTSSMIIQDAHYLASSEIYATLRGTGEIHQYDRTLRGGKIDLPQRLTCQSPPRTPGSI